MIIENAEYNNLKIDTLKKLKLLNDRIYNSPTKLRVHDNSWQVRAFYMMIDELIVSYAGVARLNVRIGRQKYKILALTWVGTDPKYRSRGIASELIRFAVDWMEKNETFDMWLFTAQAAQVSFYQQNSRVKQYDDITLVSNNSVEALNSGKIEVKVLAKPMSERGRQVLLRGGVINLGIESNQFV